MKNTLRSFPYPVNTYKGEDIIYSWDLLTNKKSHVLEMQCVVSSYAIYKNNIIYLWDILRNIKSHVI